MKRINWRQGKIREQPNYIPPDFEPGKSYACIKKWLRGVENSFAVANIGDMIEIKKQHISQGKKQYTVMSRSINLPMFATRDELIEYLGQP